MSDSKIKHMTETVEDIIFDDGERIEIVGSYPDVDTAIKALHESIE